jgi:membrane associated rhomboid family serine protease
MNGQQPMSFGLPKPGPALWSVLGVLGAFGVFSAFLATWVPGGEQVFMQLACEVSKAFTQPWRLVTSGLLTNPAQWSHLLFSLAGLYFLGVPLERRWGPWRLVRFLAIAVVLGNLATIGVAAVVPPDAQSRFRPDLVFGPTAAITAIAVAWSREFRDSTVNLFFVLPLRGATFLWLTIGLSALDLVYPTALPEGVIAPFGGIVAGLLFGGSPSLARTAWLRLRLLFLRRRASGIDLDEVLGPTRRPRRPRPGAPPLRIVGGSVDDALKKRTPPKDKRFLN